MTNVHNVNTTMTNEEMRRYIASLNSEPTQPNPTLDSSQEPSQENTSTEFVPAHRSTPWDTGQERNVQVPFTNSNSSASATTSPSVQLPSGSLAPSDPEIRQYLTSVAQQFKISPSLLMAVAQQESRYNSRALNSETGAAGMFQFIPETARGLHLDPYDWKRSAVETARNLATQIARGGTDWAIATHFAGPNQRKHGRRTAQYVAEVSAKAAAISREIGDNFAPSPETPRSERAAQPDQWHAPMLMPNQAQQPRQSQPSRQPRPPQSRSAETNAPHKPSQQRQAPPAGPLSAAQMRAYISGKQVPATRPEESLAQTLVRNARQFVSENPLGILSMQNRAARRMAEGIVNTIRSPDPVQVRLTDADLQRRFEEQQSSVFTTKPRYRVGDTPLYLDDKPTPSSLNPFAPMMNWQQFKASPFYKDWEAENRTVEMSPDSQEAQRAQWLERARQDPTVLQQLPTRFQDVRDQVNQERADQSFAEPWSWKGFAQRMIEDVRNPIDAFFSTSLPANITSALTNAPEIERTRFERGRRITSALHLINNPENASQEQLEQAHAEVKAWEQSNDPNVVTAWKEFLKGVAADPGASTAGFINAFTQDPELAFTPAGVGATPIRAARIARGITTPMTRALARADAIADGTFTAATLNAEIGAAQQYATEGRVSNSNVVMNASMGAAFGSVAAGGIFRRAAKAWAEDLGAARAQGRLDEVLRDRAEAEVAFEDILRSKLHPGREVSADLINDILGIPREDGIVINNPDVGSLATRGVPDANIVEGLESRTHGPQIRPARNSRSLPTETVEPINPDRIRRVSDLTISRWLKDREAQVRESFKNEADYADYLRNLAEVRMERAAAAAEAAQASDRAAQQRAADRAERTSRFQAEFEAAMRQRDEQIRTSEIIDAHTNALQEDRIRDLADSWNASALLDAVMTQDHAAVQQAQAAIQRREAGLPKGRRSQSGEADSRYIAGLGLVTGGALAAATAFPDDKVKAAIAGALAVGLPLGAIFSHAEIGRIRRNFRGPMTQEGAIKIARDVPTQVGEKIYRSHESVLRDALQGKFIDRDVDINTITHPATYSTRFYPIFAEIASHFGAKSVIDPMAGIGNIGQIKDHGWTGRIIANELEPEWTALHTKNGVDKSITGDARNLSTVKSNSVDMGIMSPPYANRLADKRNKGKLRILTYTNSLGRKLSEGNAGGMHWGEAYRNLHREVYKELGRVVRPGGHAVINVKDFIKSGKAVPVVDFHIKAMEEAGFVLLENRKVPVPGLIQGGVNRPKVPYENILVFKKPEKGTSRIRNRQAGQIDPELNNILAKAGIAATLAAAGYAMSPDDHKLAGGIFGGLMGLMLPTSGGSRPMPAATYLRQMGAISADGLPLGIRTQRGRIANPDLDAQLKARDNRWMNEIRHDGEETLSSQRAVYELYSTYKKTAILAASAIENSYRRTAKINIPETPEGVVDQVFADIYRRLRTDPDFQIENFGDFIRDAARKGMHAEARNELRQKRAKTLVHDSDVVTDTYEGDTTNVSAVDRTTGVASTPMGDKVVVDGIKNTPEATLMQQQLAKLFKAALETQSDTAQRAFVMQTFEGMSTADIAVALGMNEAAVRKTLSRTASRVKDLLTEKIPEVKEMLEDQYAPGHKRVIKGPKSQQGSADVGDLATLTAIAGGVGAATFFLGDKDKWHAMLSAGGAAGLAAFLRGKGSGEGFRHASRAAAVFRGVDWRMGEVHPSLYGMAKAHGKVEARLIKDYNDAILPFTQWFKSKGLTDKTRAILVEALSTRDRNVIDTMLQHLGGDTAAASFHRVRMALDAIEDRLVDLGLINKSELDYFPFRVKDLEGLKRALGQEFATGIDAAIKAANDKMQRDLNRPLNQIETDIVINKFMEPYLGQQIGPKLPGFARARTIKTIPENLQPFYHDPIATLNSYGQQAIKYIQRAEFFGKHLVKVNKEGKEVADISASIGELTRKLREDGKITQQQEFELANMLQDRFNGGEMGSSTGVRVTKDLTNASLLGQFIYSSIAQLGDTIWQIYRHGPRAGLETAIRLAVGKQFVRLKDFGLTEHMAHEYITEGWSGKLAKTALTVSGLRAIDHLGKVFGLNASIAKMMREAKSAKGRKALRERYGTYFPNEIEGVIKDLSERKVSDDAKLFAWADLTETQPLTAWELPQAYHHNPNMRILYHLQTFNLRALNLMYETGRQDIASGNPKKVLRGIRKLTGVVVAFGIAGTATDKIKDLLNGKPIELNFSDVPINSLQAAGLSMYDYDDMVRHGPQELLMNKAPPMIRIAGDIYNRPDRAVRYIPFVGKPTSMIFSNELEAFRKERNKTSPHTVEIYVNPSNKNSNNGRRGRRNNRRRNY